MFIPDERFQAIFGEADTWTLQVKYVQARDEGEYECQISTIPKKSHIIKLNIIGESRRTLSCRSSIVGIVVDAARRLTK